MTIYETIQEAYANSGLIQVENSLERFSCSLGCHLLNILNNRTKRYFHASKLMNFRTHIVFQAPSGFAKSIMLDFFLHPETGLLSGSFFPTDVEATFSPESWMGTVVSGDVEPEATEGVFERFKNGIVGADEYETLKTMAENPGERHDVVYLLKALDDGRANKNLAAGSIRINDICMTFWCGMRPTSLRFTSGLGRRFTYQTFFPTWKQAQEFKQANISTNISSGIQKDTRETLAKKINEFMEYGLTCEDVNYSIVNEWMVNNKLIPHFDMNHYRRLAVGWSIVNGTFPEVSLDGKVMELFQDEFESRRVVRDNPIREAILHVIMDEDGFDQRFLYEFFDRYYQMPKKDVRSHIRALRADGLVELKYGKFFATREAEEEIQEEKETIEEYITLGK